MWSLAVLYLVSFLSCSLVSLGEVQSLGQRLLPQNFHSGRLLVLSLLQILFLIGTFFSLDFHRIYNLLVSKTMSGNDFGWWYTINKVVCTHKCSTTWQEMLVASSNVDDPYWSFGSTLGELEKLYCLHMGPHNKLLWISLIIATPTHTTVCILRHISRARCLCRFQMTFIEIICQKEARIITTYIYFICCNSGLWFLGWNTSITQEISGRLTCFPQKPWLCLFWLQAWLLARARESRCAGFVHNCPDFHRIELMFTRRLEKPLTSIGSGLR